MGAGSGREERKERKGRGEEKGVRREDLVFSIFLRIAYVIM